MEKAAEVLNVFFLNCFAFSSLGITRHVRRFWPFLIFVVNLALTFAIVGHYVSSGKIFVSGDPLSQATDVFELFAPTLVHLAVMTSYLCNRKMFLEIHRVIEEVDSQLSKMNGDELRKAKVSSTFSAAWKFFAIHATGFGIEIFHLST